MAYATAQDLLNRYDARRVADLVSDAGSRTLAPQSSPVLLACLDDASGEVDAACRVAQRYTQADLLGLTGNANALLVRLVCDLAYGMLVARRGYTANDSAVMAPREKLAFDTLESLRRGERLFSGENQADAGVNVVPLRATTTGYSSGTDLVGRSQRLWGNRSV